jgi:hypothetical protein
MALDEVALRKAYSQSTAETAALKATVATLTKQLDEHIVFLALPLPDPATSPSAMEEMTMQLSHIQHDIQDVLDVKDCQDHAPRSSHHHSQTVDLHHDCCYRICYLQGVGRFHYGFICYESFCLSHLLSVCLVL